MRVFVFIFICYALITSKFKIDKHRLHFIDDKGRVTIFHGVNVMNKQPPYIPIVDRFDPLLSMSKEDIVYLKNFGFNFVRLGVIWESVERSPGRYDFDHLDNIEKLINNLGENGIHVLLDAHQDMFSRIFCGEGVPTFYAKELEFDEHCHDNYLSIILKTFGVCLPLSLFQWRYDKEGLPHLDDCKHFLKYHQSPELTTIYNSFYNNQHGIQDKFISFWKVLATRFKENPYIIGYDLWNEPWPGNLWSNLNSFWPGWSTNNQLLPFYSKVDEEIRKIKDDYIFFFEPIPFPDTVPLFGGKVLGGFTSTPAGKNYLDKQVLNLHSYCCQARADACEKGEPHISDAIMCKDFHQHKMEAHLKNARELGVPLIISEFGACSDSEACYEEMNSLVEVAGENFVSWAYWMYKPFDDHTTTAKKHTEGVFYEDGNLQEVKVKALMRTYMQKYQGTPIMSKFDTLTGTYLTSFIYDNNIRDPSVLYVNKDYFYKNGFIFNLYDNRNKKINFECIEEGNYLNILIKDVEFLFKNKAETINFALVPNKISSNSIIYNISEGNKNFLELIGADDITVKIITNDNEYNIKYNGKIELEHAYIKKIELINTKNTVQVDIDNVLYYDIKVYLN